VRDAVQAAVRQYLAELDGQMSTEVYQMVLAQMEAPLLEEIMAEAAAQPSQAPQRPVGNQPAAPRDRSAEPRMPSVEDFPAIAQDQLRARAEGHHGEDGEKGALGLLRKLAHVGMPRREDEAPAPQSAPQAHYASQHEQGAPVQRAPAPRQAHGHEAHQPQAGHDGLGRRSAPPATPNRAPEEDSMDIPAFLRRKSG